MAEPEAKRALGFASGALAVDMESCAVRSLCVRAPLLVHALVREATPKVTP